MRLLFSGNVVPKTIFLGYDNVSELRELKLEFLAKIEVKSLELLMIQLVHKIWTVLRIIDPIQKKVESEVKIQPQHTHISKTNLTH